MKRLLAMLLTVAMTLSLAACGDRKNLEADPTQNPGSVQSEVPETPASAKIGVVFTTGGLGDNNFNDMVYAGLKQAQEELGITFNYAEPASGDEYTSMTYDFAQDGSYDLIIALSGEGATAVEQVAEDYPNQKFTVVDNSVDAENVCSIVKTGAEQTFLVGVMAGLITSDSSYEYANEQKKVGAILGMDSATVVSMAAGFACGAAFYDPEVETLTSTVGDFSDVNTAKEMAASLYDQGVDVIMNLDGGGTGIWAAADEKHFYGIGCGTNQNAMSPYIFATAGFVLTSLVYEQCRQIIDGTWAPGVQRPTIRDGAFEYLLDGASVEVSDEVIAKVEAAREWYENTDVALVTTMEEVAGWAAQYNQAS